MVNTRLKAMFCIGCGRLDAPQLCPQGCDEQAIDLVFGDAYDAVSRDLADNLRKIQTLEELVLGSVAQTSAGGRTSDPPQAEPRANPHAVQAEARTVLRLMNVDDAERGGTADEVTRVTAWHCSRCGWIEAPQPCLGVCVFHAVDLVPAIDDDNVRQQCEQARRRLDELTALVRQLAWVTPRADAWEKSRRAWEARARHVLDSPADGQVVV